ncbi:MAG TPA: NAD-glutamate dehydrogenase, partial [Salinarimonas sp.]|nr:NAD-glutamate dehydrogenase [Salinarimonas sp.]
MDTSTDTGTGRPVAEAAAVAEARGQPAAAALAGDLFGRVPADDLRPYSPETLADLAAGALEHLSAPRPAGEPDIVLRDIEIESGGRRRELTVVEALNRNVPFLLDSTLAEIVDQGYEPRLVAHPILAVERDREGRLVRLLGDATAASPSEASRESLIHIHLDFVDDPGARERLAANLRRTCEDVMVAVADWPAMRARIEEAIASYRSGALPLPADEVAEALAFLDWIAAGNFTFLGVRAYRFPDGDVAADPVAGSGLGLLRNPEVRVLRRGAELVAMTAEVRAFLQRPRALIIAKANVKSRVHRRVHLDYVGVKLFSADGRLEGELRVIGLFTSSAYTGSTAEVPYLRRKVARIVDRAGFDPASYSGRALLNVLESYPRDELFQVDEETLYRFAIEIMRLSERPTVRALARVDEFDRFVSVLVFIPKDRYDTNVRRRVGEFLAGIYGGRVSAAYPAYPEGPLSRTHYIVGRYEGSTPEVDRETLESGIRAIVRTWADSLRDALVETTGGGRARA